MRTVLITGGAGFVGTNTAHALLESGERVRILDDLSRPGVERNLNWLQQQHGDRLQVELGDIRDRGTVAKAMREVDDVFHFAAQVAVTTSLDAPLADAEINLLGTLNLLEEARSRPRPPAVIFTSTNKVYGSLPGVGMVERDGRYEPADARLRTSGIDESRPLQFSTPYGCSKGAADQYVLDFSHSYGVPSVVFRMSCIYGPHQFGTEDQGWVAHFLLSAIAEEPITIFGDGRQVRDILFVEDLVRAFRLARDGAGELAGQAFNIGGGPANAVSLLEVLELIARLRGTSGPAVEWASWRPSDQRYYVTNHARFTAATGWLPEVSPEEGLTRLDAWLRETADVSAAAA